MAPMACFLGIQNAKAGKSSDDDDDENKEAATNQKSAAASELRKPRVRPKLRRGRPPKTPERKEEPDVVHRPDVTRPVTGTKVA